jgi:CobQ-like glutamine amidotransferase family enzyme
LALAPTKSYQVEIDKVQEIILDGGTQLPKITSIKAAGSKGKPMLTVMSGLQVLE